MQRFIIAAFTFLIVSAIGFAAVDEEKIPLDKLPKVVVETVQAKFPKAELKHAAKDTRDGKLFYEVGINLDKVHMHCLVTPEGKLFEIHRDIEAKDVPEIVTKAVQTKYPKANWENIEQMNDVEGKILGYEVSVNVDGAIIEVVVNPAGMITKETKVSPPVSKGK